VGLTGGGNVANILLKHTGLEKNVFKVFKEKCFFGFKFLKDF